MECVLQLLNGIVVERSTGPPEASDKLTVSTSFERVVVHGIECDCVCRPH